ncbi:MAG: carboxypeptidase-like regulatory domain-containing protein [Chthoniobacteraceae bacterium]
MKSGSLPTADTGGPNKGKADRYEPAPAQVSKFMEAFATPIIFYGKVIDQHGTPVSGAAVTLSPNDNPLGGKTSKHHQTTDSAGLFSVVGLHGITLAVEVKKAGYYQIPSNGRGSGSNGLFEFGVPSTRGPHRPEKDNPVIFTLQKSEALEPLVTVGKENFSVSRDGTPRTISLNPGDASGAEQVTLRCWTKDLQRPSGQRQYDWRLEISVPAGGLFPRADAFAFEAPEEDYQQSEVVDMPASLPSEKWRDFAARSYFLKFSNGKFGRVDIEMQAGGDHFVVWKSYLNPKAGSRNIEADPRGQ